MIKNYVLKITLVSTLLFTVLMNAQTKISSTSSGFTTENTKADGGNKGSFKYKTLPIARPSWNGNAAEGKKAYFNFDLKDIKKSKVKTAYLNLTFDSIENEGNDEGFTILLKAYVEDGNNLPLEPNHGNFDFSIGFTTYNLLGKVYYGGGDYPKNSTVLSFDIQEFLNEILQNSKSKVLFELSIKEKSKDKFFRGRIASNLNYNKSFKPLIIIE